MTNGLTHYGTFFGLLITQTELWNISSSSAGEFTQQGTTPQGHTPLHRESHDTHIAANYNNPITDRNSNEGEKQENIYMHAYGKEGRNRQKVFTVYQKTSRHWTPILTYIEHQNIPLKQIALLGLKKLVEIIGSTFSNPSYVLIPKTAANLGGHLIQAEAKRNNIIAKYIKKHVNFL